MTQDNEMLFKNGKDFFVCFDYVVSKSGREILPLGQNSQKYVRSILDQNFQPFSSSLCQSGDMAEKQNFLSS